MARRTAKVKKKPGLLTYIVIAVLILMFFAAAGSDPSSNDDVTLQKASDASPTFSTQTVSVTVAATSPDATASVPHLTTTPEPTRAPTPSPSPTAAPTASPTATATRKPAASPKVTTPVEHTYVLNTSTRKFHHPSCKSVNKIKDKNKSTFTGTREELLQRGYSPCGNCDP